MNCYNLVYFSISDFPSSVVALDKASQRVDARARTAEDNQRPADTSHFFAKLGLGRKRGPSARDESSKA